MSLSSTPSPATPGSLSSSAWQRSRYWTTAAVVGAFLVGMSLLSFGHTLHGALMLLAAGVLLRHSVLSRRARRQLAVANMRRAYQGAGPAAH